MALTSEVISLLVINHFRFRHNLNGWRCYTIGEQQEDGQRKVVFVRQKLFEYVGGGMTPPLPRLSVLVLSYLLSLLHYHLVWETGRMWKV